MKFKKSSAVLLIITLYGVNYFVFERIFFFNELLSLIGFVYFIQHSFTRDYKFRSPQSIIYKSVLLFILLCGFYALLSLWLKTNWYYYFRNLSIIYSVFGFFIGYRLYFDQFDFFNKLKGTIYGYALIAFSFGSPSFIDRNAYSFWFALLQKNWKIVAVFGFIVLHILYFISYTSLTIIVIMMSVLAMRFVIKTYAQFKLMVLVAFIAFSIIFVLAVPYLKTYGHGGYFLFGNVVHVYSQHSWFWIDHNSSWRLLFWYRTVIETFPQNLLGIGIGTPLLPYMQNMNTTQLPFNDEQIAHVIGTHNTFITVMVRFGIFSILLLAIIYRSIFSEFFRYKQYYLKNKNDVGLFLSFLVLTIVGLFNLLLETPTLSVLYWVSLGFVAKAINNRKNGNYEVQNM